MIESGGKIMAAKIITIVFVMLLISMESPTTTQAHHTQDMQEMKEMPMMKSDGPVAALQCEPVDIMAGKPETITIFVKDSAGKPEKDSPGRMTGLCMWLSRAGISLSFPISIRRISGP
jgi:hypothetical protein